MTTNFKKSKEDLRIIKNFVLEVLKEKNSEGYKKYMEEHGK